MISNRRKLKVVFHQNLHGALLICAYFIIIRHCRDGQSVLIPEFNQCYPPDYY